MAKPETIRGRIFGAATVTAEVIGMLLQLLLVWVGAQIIWGSDVPELETALRLLWCTIAIVYLGFTVLGLNVLVRVDAPDPRATRVLVGHPLTRFMSTALSLAASLLGLTAAIELIIAFGEGQHEPLSEVTAVASMLLAWAIFNWGYARIYFSRYHRAKEPPLLFPGTDDPRLIDFVYLAFTNATTFAVSDVKVVSTRMRWTIVWHTSIAFFFNALIIALTLNVITNGGIIADLFN